MKQPDPVAAANEFDLWADAGRAESMADGHRGVTEAAIRNWQLDGSSVVLDVGCGNGWAVQTLVNRGAGAGIGVDISKRMIARARAASVHDTRFRFDVAHADQLPIDDHSISHILNVESLYYYPFPERALCEWARVTRNGGVLAIVVDLYAENVATHSWIDALDIEVHLLSAPQIVSFAEAAGWKNVSAEQVLDPRPITPRESFSTSKYWPSYEMYVQYRETGALVIHGER